MSNKCGPQLTSSGVAGCTVGGPRSSNLVTGSSVLCLLEHGHCLRDTGRHRQTTRRPDPGVSPPPTALLWNKSLWRRETRHACGQEYTGFQLTLPKETRISPMRDARVSFEADTQLRAICPPTMHLTLVQYDHLEPKYKHIKGCSKLCVLKSL